MKKQLYGSDMNIASFVEPRIIIEESTSGDEEEGQRNESPQRRMDSNSSPPKSFLASSWKEVRRLSNHGEEGSETGFLSTLSQTSAPQLGDRKHSVVSIEKMSPTLFGRNRRGSNFPFGRVTRILPSRDSEFRMSPPPSGSGSTHSLQLDIMDDIADLKAKKMELEQLLIRRKLTVKITDESSRYGFHSLFVRNLAKEARLRR